MKKYFYDVFSIAMMIVMLIMTIWKMKLFLDYGNIYGVIVGIGLAITMVWYIVNDWKELYKKLN